MVFLQNYSVQKKIPLSYHSGIPIPPYNSRMSKLSNAEKMAVSCYKDLNNPQSRWDYPIPKDRSTAEDCYMINYYMRGEIHPTSLHDIRQVERYISLIKSAILSFSNPRACRLFRGYSNPERMLDLKENHMFTEDAFTSCSELQTKAEDYALDNPEIETPVISICDYPPHTNMLYFDEDEYEWLLLPATYLIFKIVPAKIRGKEGLIYYIKKTH